MKRNINLLRTTRFMVGAFMIAATITSCTDLELEETDSVISDASFAGVTEPASFLDGVFGQLYGQIGTQSNIFALSEVTTDAALIPTRGADWGDNGAWRQLHQHNWPVNQRDIEATFQEFNSIHFKAAQVLSELTTAATAEDRGNALFLRAMGMWVILDNFAQIPVRDPAAPLFDDVVVLRGQEAIDQIVSDLNEAIDVLPAGGPGAGSGEFSAHIRPTKAAARFLLAKVLLNKHIYLETSPDNADMQQVVSLVDQIAGENYGIESGYFNIFRPESDNESILVGTAATEARVFNGLHYNSSNVRGGGWNGFSTLAEYYDLFEGDPNINVAGSGQEERRGFVPTMGTPFTGEDGTEDVLTHPLPANTDQGPDGFTDGSAVGVGFLIGQQYGDTGVALEARNGGGPLEFTRDFTDGNGDINLINNNEKTGIRVTKYNISYDQGRNRNHLIVFRYSDAHLMKAEAIHRSGGDATAMINELRLIRNATPLGAVTDQDILDERGRELYAELWRRNDLVRFGQFTNDWQLKDPAYVGDDTRNKFPIPASQLILNPNLTQNPGY